MPPLGDDDFAAAMAAAEPFEARPLLGVAVSGGPDSMALCLLAHTWTAARGGRILALTLDHGLRRTSAAEAACVHAWLVVRDIDHEILRWTGEKPRTALETKARQARYRVLSAHCHRRGVLHLLVGHHLHDQVETVVMRTERGSGAHGLAAMAAVVETSCVRVIRPLLAVSPLRLRAYLLARGQAWIEDPTNRDVAFTRARLRATPPDKIAAGQAIETTAALADQRAAERERDEVVVAALLAQHCRLHPTGFAVLEVAVLTAAPAPIVTMALARLAMTIGGKRYPPGTDALKRLQGKLDAGLAGTLGRCRWQRWTIRGARDRRAKGILVCREARGLPGSAALAANSAWTWDGRFTVRVDAMDPARFGGLRLGALGEEGWREAVRMEPALRRMGVPWQAALALPVLRDAQGLVAIPTLEWWRNSGSVPERNAAAAVAVALEPLRSLSGTGYFLA